ncbi:hypothetical protein C370_07350 [Cryptococcus neoformans A1-35-8]|nr:hypothetical protein C370_07350 [Cryptococcus neoformans var. grubii A1-35-8]
MLAVLSMHERPGKPRHLGGFLQRLNEYSRS